MKIVKKLKKEANYVISIFAQNHKINECFQLEGKRGLQPSFEQQMTVKRVLTGQRSAEQSHKVIIIIAPSKLVVPQTTSEDDTTQL